MRQLPLNLPHRPAMSGEDFLVAPCNQEAVAWLDRWPDWPAPFVVLYGESGCGKSHLVEVFKKATGANDILLTSDPYESLGSLKAATLDDLVVEDETQEKALFHLYNHGREQGATILITAKTPPVKWALGLADLKSRLRSVPAVEISNPDDPLMEAILVKLFSDRQLKVDASVTGFLLKRMERSFSAAQKLVAAIDQHALASKRKITTALVRDVLEQSF